MAQVRLQRSSVMPRLGQGIAAGMPKHMGVDLKAQPRSLASALYHSAEARCVERRTALRDKHKGRGFLLGVALMLAQCPKLAARQGVR